MNSDYVTALRVQQHQADFLRQAAEHRLGQAARPRRPERSPRRWTAGWRRREALPSRRPEVAGA